MITKRRFLAVLLGSGLVFAACVEPDQVSWGGSVDTLSSGVPVVRNPADGLWESPRRLVEDLRIGSVDGGGPDQFGRVADATMDEARMVYVLDSHAHAVRVFDADGVFVRSLGRKGSGPGELNQPIALEWDPSGRLWVVDFGNRRYEVFDTAGAYVTSYRMSDGSFGFGNSWRSDALLYERAVEFVDGRRRLLVVRRRLVGDSLVVLDTLAVPETAAAPTIEVTFKSDSTSFTADWPIPLAPRSVLKADAFGLWWLSDPGQQYRIAVLDSQGDTVRLLERTYKSVPVSSEVEALIFEDMSEQGIELVSEIPDVHPPIEDLLPGDSSLWVRRQTDTNRTGYEVFDAKGRFLGELSTRVPVERFHVTDRIHGSVVGVLTDPLDVPYVLRLSIVE